MAEIVRTGDRQPVVADVQGAGQAVVEDRSRLQGRQQCGGRDRGEHQHRGCRGEKPTGPRGVEPNQVDPSGFGKFGKQQSGDQETGDHEEDVNADEAPTDGADVERDDREDCDRAEPLDVGAEIKSHPSAWGPANPAPRVDIGHSRILVAVA